MTYFAVNYRYDTATALHQDRMRPEHRAYLAELFDQGALLASGPLLENPAAPSALLIFRAENEGQLRDLIAGDPFQKAGYVAETTMTAWNPVIGVFASA